MKSTFELHTLINAAVRTNTPESAVELMSTLSPGQRATALGLLFSTFPLPKTLIDGVFRAGQDLLMKGAGKGEWMTQVAQSAPASPRIPWADILSFLEVHAGRGRVREHIQAIWSPLFISYANNELEPALKQGASDLLEGILDYTNGGILEDLDTISSTQWGALFRLATGANHGAQWTEHASVDFNAMVAEAWEQPGGLLDLIRPSLHLQVSRLDGWLTHDGRRKAFERYAREDLDRAKRGEDWRMKWVPNGKWMGSPLQEWCHRAKSSQMDMTDNPFDDLIHPQRFVALPAKTQSRLIRHPFLNIQNDVFIRKNQKDLRFAIGRILDNAVMPEMCHDTPVDGTAMGLNLRQEWAGERMKNPDFLPHIRQLMEDPRAGRMLGAWRGSNVLDWMLSEPSWQTWRNARGQSLVDVWTEGTRERNNTASISTAGLLKLAKRCPEVLTHTTQNDGRSTLDRLSLFEPVRARIKAALLKQLVKPAGRTRQRPGRTL